MKRLLKIALIAIPVLIIVVLVGLYFSLNWAVEKGIETVGPKITKTSVTLDGVSLSPFSGRGEIEGFVLGNPEGFKSESAIKVGKVTIEVDPNSVTSDVIVVKEIIVEAPEITYEASLITGSNISRIQKNIEESTKVLTGEGEAEPAPKEEEGEGKKIIINHFLVKNGKIRVVSKDLLGTGTVIPLADVEQKDIGKDTGGLTAGEAASRTLGIVLSGVTQAVTKSGQLLGDTGKTVGDTTKKVGETVGDTASKIGEGLKGIIGGKE